jgi:hypothetical protein
MSNRAEVKVVRRVRRVTLQSLWYEGAVSYTRRQEGIGSRSRYLLRAEFLGVIRR